MNLSVSLKSLPESHSLKQAHATHVANQALGSAGATVTVGAATPPRVMHGAGPAGVPSPAAAGADPMAGLRGKLLDLRTAVEAFRDELNKQYKANTLPKDKMDELLMGWSRLDSQLSELLLSD